MIRRVLLRSINGRKDRCFRVVSMDIHKGLVSFRRRIRDRLIRTRIKRILSLLFIDILSYYGGKEFILF